VLGCSDDLADEIKTFYSILTKVQKLNIEVVNETSLRPIVGHTVNVLTPRLKLKPVICVDTKVVSKIGDKK